MSATVNNASRWFYRGIWGVLRGAFRVPDEPPRLPALGGHEPTSFRPSDRFLTYLKIQFWLAAFILGSLDITGLLGISAGSWRVGLGLSPFGLAILAAGIVIGYLAIHLRYDTTWYVISDRSLRIRRGIWIIRETTITFENVQNVSVNQGPLQRFCGIANVLVETAGGGGGAGAHGGKGGQATATHQGLIEGIADAERIRDLLLGHLQQSKSAGLGDDAHHGGAANTTRGVGTSWTPRHLTVLREIRDEASRLAAGPTPIA